MKPSQYKSMTLVLYLVGGNKHVSQEGQLSIWSPPSDIGQGKSTDPAFLLIFSSQLCRLEVQEEVLNKHKW